MEKISDLKDFLTNIGVCQLELYKTEYADGSGQIALVAMISGSGEKYSTFTLNLAEMGVFPSNENNVFIKGYSEGEGIADELVKHGVIAEPEKVYTINRFGSKVYEAQLLK